MRKTVTRIIAGLLAALMLGSILWQALSFFAGAATPDPRSVYVERYSRETDNIVRGGYYTIEFDITDSNDNWPDDIFPGSVGNWGSITVDNYQVSLNWSKANATLRFEKIGTFLSGTDEMARIRVKLINIYYDSLVRNPLLAINAVIPTGKSAPDDKYNLDISFDLPSSYFPTDTTEPEDPVDPTNPYGSDIVVEAVYAYDANGTRLEKITKDTPAFTLEIIYVDVHESLRGTYYSDYYNSFSYTDYMEAYLTNSGGFAPQSSSRGKLTQIAPISSGLDAPRFRATFSNIKYKGGGGSVGFRVIYDIDGWEVSGAGDGTLYAVEDGGEDDESGEIPPPTPYIIVSKYDYGSEQIEAGNTFTLGISFQNTSKELPVENIRMVVNPVAGQGTTESSYLSIASATNTYYYERMDAEGVVSQNVDIRVKSTATVGSQALSIRFIYEYVLDKKRAQDETETVVYIPITQISRFSVDPLTDYSQYMQLGDEGYAVVSFVNQGKSDTYNVSGYILNADGTPGQTEHFGNLKAGDHGSLDFTIQPDTVGDYQGTIIITYEDDAGNVEEIPVTFTAWVEEPYRPSFTDPVPDPGLMEPQEPGLPPWKIVMVSIGSLAIAIPVALYMIKRIKANGSEEFDEDF